MSAARLSFLFILFFLDVHVRAETILSADGAASREIKLGSTELHLAPGALATRTDDSVHLVRGDLYVEGSVRLSTPFAIFGCDQSDCAAIFTRRSDAVEISSVAGAWSVRPRGHASDLGVERGTSVSIGEVGADGRAAPEPPRALVWTPFVKTWSRCFAAGDFARFAARVRHFRPTWDDAVERLAEDQRGRALAAVERNQREIERRARAAAAVAAEDAQLRRLFREKNLVDD